jgi:histidyl-tRNA synthetase
MASSKKFQAPRGTRDFYPADMAVRRYIESVWRTTSINHGFEEVEGPTIEHLDLYTHKSGPGIVSELFQVYSGKDDQQIAAIRSGEDAPYAMRPEFTPTLARMVAARAAQLPKPIKWFAIPGHYRAERPQRGRLREFFQWNVDFIGGELEPAQADAEVIAVAVASLEAFGLTPESVQVQVNSRSVLAELLNALNVPKDNCDAVYALIDKRSKIDAATYQQEASQLGFDAQRFDQETTRLGNLLTSDSPSDLQVSQGKRFHAEYSFAEIRELFSNLANHGISDWIDLNINIVRGLAYYTGTVFEIIADGERAVAGGGRYDKLIESFGGPSMPACGFGMGDVVLGLLLHDKGLLPEEVYMKPLRPHVFVIAANDDAAAKLPSLVAQLRNAGMHVRHSYRTTRNVGKLLGEAGKALARIAVILGDELAQGTVELKDLESGEQRTVPIASLSDDIRLVLDAQEKADV